MTCFLRYVHGVTPRDSAARSATQPAKTHGTSRVKPESTPETSAIMTTTKTTTTIV